jgi:hypothetical protein
MSCKEITYTVKANQGLIGRERMQYDLSGTSRKHGMVGRGLNREQQSGTRWVYGMIEKRWVHVIIIFIHVNLYT